MKKSLFIIPVLLILFSSPAYSKIMYIIDEISITVRSQTGDDFKTVDQLNSHEPVNLLRSEGSWALISFKDNKTGWVLQQYLTEKTPMPIQIAELKKTINAHIDKISALEKENVTLKQSKAEMVELTSRLKIENQSLKEEPYKIIFLVAGAGIFLLGCIVTLMLQRSGQKRRRRLSF